MEVMASEIPLKDGGNMVTNVSSGNLTEGTNSSADCSEEGVGITAELHNGGEEVGNPNDSKGDPKTKKKENENPKKAARMRTGDPHSESPSEDVEKWRLHLSVTDSASASDNDVSEAEASERNEDKSEKLPGDNNPLPDTDADDSVDFLGFEMGTASSEDPGAVELTKLIGHVESALECAKRDPYGASTSHDFEDLETGFEDDDTEMKLASYGSGTSSEIFIDYDAMDADDCESIKYSLKLISNVDVPRTREEGMHEEISSSNNADGVRNVRKISRRNRRSKNLMKIKQEDKIFSGDGTGSETKKKRKKFKEEEVQAGDVYSLQDVSAQMDMSLEVSGASDLATPVKADSVSGTASEDVSSEVTSSAASSPSVSSRSSLKVSGSGGRYSRGDSPALSSSGGKGKKVLMDLSNPAYLKPFQYGWKRELVYRNTSESTFKKMADIYYYTPSGKKVRSNREVLEYLDSEDLTIENFTFFKEALGLDDPSKEVIRDAKKILTKDPSAPSTKKTTKMKPVSEKSSSLPEALSSSTQSESPKSSHQGRTAPPKTFPKIKVSSVKLQRLPLSKLCGNRQKKNDSSEDGEMEIGMLPPMWNPDDSPFLKKAAGSSQSVTTVTWSSKDGEDVGKGKRKLVGHESDSPVAAKRLKSSDPSQGQSLETERRFMQYFMMNVCAGYSSLLHVFQYLKVQELLRAARVCRMWHDVASHPSLWRIVRMKNSHVGDWEGLVKSLCRHETQHLDLRKMLVPNEDTNSMWDEFCRAIVHASSLSRLDLCRCPAQVVERVAESCPQLKIINALSIRCSNINVQCLGNQRNLQELRLKSVSGIHLTTTLTALKQLSSLKHLSLTTFKELGKMEPSVLGHLKNLESLELGECCDFPPEFGPESLSRLKKLERLRLEKGQGKDCPTFSILAGIAALPKLTHLELVNFDVKPGFDKALAQCTNIRRLLIIPTYVTQSATTNHMVLNGVNQLCNSLTHFVWGVTHELLRVTELFVDQCEGQKDTKAPPSKSGKKSSGSDSIPILKPVQIKDDCETEKSHDQENELESNRNGDTKSAEDAEDKDESDDAKTSAAAPQVEILPLPKLQKLLTSSLPKTRVKILKIPFHATWRQTISEPAP